MISQASGTFQITNSRDGQAIFQAQGLAPGRSVTGTVQLSNTGTLAGDLDLQQLDVVDQPGMNGGRLSDAVHLDVQDVTGGNLVPVFAGQLASLQNRPLGNLARRRGAHLPLHRLAPRRRPAPPSPTSGDNAYAGSALSVRYSWQASAPDPGGGGGGGGGGGTGPSGTESDLQVPRRLQEGAEEGRARRDGELRPGLHGHGLRPAAQGKEARPQAPDDAAQDDHPHRPEQGRAHPAEAEQEAQAPAEEGASQEEEGRDDAATQRRAPRPAGRRRPTARRSSSSGRRRSAPGAASRSPSRSPARARAR